jgi:hypothetical protein
MLGMGLQSGRAWPTPNAIPGLSLWLDANHDPSFASDAFTGVASSWTSRDANARVFTPVSATATSFPVRLAKPNWNGRKVVCSQLGAPFGLASPAYDIAANFAANGTDITIFIAAHTDDNSHQFGTVYYHYSTGAIGHYFRFNNTAGNVRHLCLSSSGFVAGGNADYLQGEKIIRLQRSGSTQSAFINGAQESSVSSTPTPIVSTVTPMYIGTQTTSGGGGLVGDLAEIIMYARALSAAECQKVENYLAAKWMGIN